MKNKVLIICAAIMCMAVTVVLCSEYGEGMDDASDYTAEFVSEENNAFEDECATADEWVSEEETAVMDDAFSEEMLCAILDSMSVMTMNDDGNSNGSVIKKRFIETAEYFQMTVSEMQSIALMMAENYDAETLLDIYEFIRHTDKDIDIIESLYSFKDRNGKYWIYDAYDALYNREDDVLSVDDVAYYVGCGISADEIAGIYNLSLAGEKSTKQMLDERIDGKTWNEIAASSVTDSTGMIEDAPEMTIYEIMRLRNTAIMQRADFCDVIDIGENGIVLCEEAIQKADEIKAAISRLKTKYNVENAESEEEENDAVEYSDKKIWEYEEEVLFEEDLWDTEQPEE